MSYGKRSRKQYGGRIPHKKAVKLWVRTAQSLSEGRGIPRGTPSFYRNPYGEPLVKSEPLNIHLDPATSIVMAGFYLFGPHWPKVYENIRVPDRRGKLRKLPRNMMRGFGLMKMAVQKRKARKTFTF